MDVISTGPQRWIWSHSICYTRVPSFDSPINASFKYFFVLFRCVDMSFRSGQLPAFIMLYVLCHILIIFFFCLIYYSRSVHLSNVAVQENYVNGKRSTKLPDNNFMTSEQFKEYLRYLQLTFSNHCLKMWWSLTPQQWYSEFLSHFSQSLFLPIWPTCGLTWAPSMNAFNIRPTIMWSRTQVGQTSRRRNW